MGWVRDDEIELLATGVREIDQGAMNSDLGETRHWFQGREPYFDVLVDCDLELTEDEDGIPMPHHIPRWLQVTLRARVLTWERGGAVMTGRTDESEIRETHATPVRMVDADTTVDPRVLQVVLAILERRPDEPILAAALAALRAAL
jgi:hypothetical protein